MLWNQAGQDFGHISSLLPSGDAFVYRELTP